MSKITSIEINKKKKIEIGKSSIYHAIINTTVNPIDSYQIFNKTSLGVHEIDLSSYLPSKKNLLVDFEIYGEANIDYIMIFAKTNSTPYKRVLAIQAGQTSEALCTNSFSLPFKTDERTLYVYIREDSTGVKYTDIRIIGYQELDEIL